MLIDAHAHLDRYGDELESALMEIAQHGIFTISNSMDPPSYRRNLDIAEKCRLVLPTFGIHPRRAPEYANRLEELRAAAEQSPIIGEIGLDHYWVEDRSQYPAQQKVLEFFLKVAKEQNKIVNLHTKGAERNILEMLVHHDVQKAIVHWYSGPLEILRAMVDRGCYFTIGVEVLYSEHIQAIARELPMIQLLTETDNPGGQKWLTGEVGMPQLIRQIIQKVADLKEMNPKDVIRTIEANFTQLIRNDSWLAETRAKSFC
jgi:TatD DNase family protein